MVRATTGDRPDPRVVVVEPFPKLPTSGSHLPVPLSDFIERPREVEALRALLSEAGVRLVTLTGPGGAGKTRLALRLAAELEPAIVAGAHFVPMASVSDPALIPTAIALALGIHLSGDQRLGTSLAALLRHDRMLLVLDNFEHILPAAPVVSESLQACPGLQVLVTSRAPLRLTGEHVLPVPGMHQPDPRVTTSAEALATEAVRLFVARATEATALFALTDENAADVAEICRRLDGLPLAIELAAARVPMLAPKALLDQLERGLSLLKDGPRDAPKRLRTLGDAIAWSCDLLAPSEQRLLRRLAVFAGGCSLDGAEAVGDSPNVLDDLAVLVDGSLVQTQLSAGEVPRYVLLETVREFGLRHLAASGDEAAARAAHATYYLDLAEGAWPHWSTPDEAAWSARFKAEQDNFRAALAWLKQAGDISRSVRLIGALWPYWMCQEHWLEGLPWVRQALVWTAGARTRERVRILNGAATLNCSLIKDYDPAGPAWSEESLSLADEIGDVEGALHALGSIAYNALVRGDFDLATNLTEAGLARVRTQGTALPNAAYEELRALGFLGYVALERHDDLRAEQLISEVRARKLALGYLSGEAGDLLLLAVLAYRRGDLTLALARCQEGLPPALAIGGLQTLLFLLDRLAVIAGDVAQADHAARLGGAVERLHELLTTAPNPKEQPDRDRAAKAARCRLGDEAFAAAWAEGRRMRPEDAVAIGLAITPSEELLAAVNRRRLAAREGLLSARERDVLCLVATGQTDQEIAAALFLSRRTVNAHVAHILAKLHVATRREAVARGRELGLLTAGSAVDRYT